MTLPFIPTTYMVDMVLFCLTCDRNYVLTAMGTFAELSGHTDKDGELYQLVLTHCISCESTASNTSAITAATMRLRLLPLLSSLFRSQRLRLLLIERAVEYNPLRTTPHCGAIFIARLQEQHRHRCLGRTLSQPSHLCDAKCKRRVIHALRVSGCSGQAPSSSSSSAGGPAPHRCSTVLDSGRWIRAWPYSSTGGDVHALAPSPTSLLSVAQASLRRPTVFETLGFCH